MVVAGNIDGVATVSVSGDGDATRLVCGFLESSEMLATAVVPDMPHLLIERTEGDPVTGMLARTVGEILRQLELAQPGAPLLLGKLMELLFVEVLRRHAAQLPENATGLLAALNDPIVARTLQAIHADPTRRWNVEMLAARPGLRALYWRSGSTR